MFRELTRKNKMISMEECIQLLKDETRGVLSVIGDDDYPYGMPMNHWYNEEDGKIYFHSWKLKIEGLLGFSPNFIFFHPSGSLKTGKR